MRTPKSFATLLLVALAMGLTPERVEAQTNSQRPETLYYYNNVYLIYDYPLDQNATLYNRIKKKHKLQSVDGIARGYVGNWSIKDDQIYLTNLELYYGKIYNVKHTYLSPYTRHSIIEHCLLPAAWVNGEYEAVDQTTREKGVFTFQDGHLVSCTFKAGLCVYKGWSSEKTQQELEYFLHTKYPEVSGNLQFVADYSNFVGQTPTSVDLDVKSISPSLSSSSVLSSIQNDIREFLIKNACMPLYVSNGNPHTFDNHLEVNLRGQQRTPAAKKKR